MLFVLLACSKPAPAPSVADAPLPTIDVEDPETCVACHDVVVAEWTQSIHAMAHHDHDPIYGAMRTLRMEKQGADIAQKCAQCHNPQAPDAVDSPAGLVGVACAACHNTVHIEPGKKGAAALVRGEQGMLVGPHPPENPGAAPHGRGPTPDHFSDGQTLCLACHDATKNPAGIDACTTGPELRSHDATASCTSCHMPETQGKSGVVSTRESHASHAFLGPHRAWLQQDNSLLAQAVDLSATLQGDTLTATLINESGHGFPTGFPGRMAIIRAIGFDGNGDEVWFSHELDPMTEDPDAVLGKVYTKDGVPTMPPFADTLQRDTRLKPGETRTVSWTLPIELETAQVQLTFRLLPPPAAQALGLQDSLEAEPRLVETVAATISSER